MAIRSYKTDLSSGMIGKVGLFFFTTVPKIITLTTLMVHRQRNNYTSILWAICLYANL